MSIDIVHRRTMRPGDGWSYPGLDPNTALTVLNLAVGEAPEAEQVREATESIVAAYGVTKAEATRYLERLVRSWRVLTDPGVAA